MDMKAYEEAIEALLGKVKDAQDAAEASRLAEVAINLSHAAVAMSKEKAANAEADNGKAGS